MSMLQGCPTTWCLDKRLLLKNGFTPRPNFPITTALHWDTEKDLISHGKDFRYINGNSFCGKKLFSEILNIFLRSVKIRSREFAHFNKSAKFRTNKNMFLYRHCDASACIYTV